MDRCHRLLTPRARRQPPPAAHARRRGRLRWSLTCPHAPASSFGRSPTAPAARHRAGRPEDEHAPRRRAPPAPAQRRRRHAADRQRVRAFGRGPDRRNDHPAADSDSDADRHGHDHGHGDPDGHRDGHPHARDADAGVSRRAERRRRDRGGTLTPAGAATSQITSSGPAGAPQTPVAVSVDASARYSQHIDRQLDADRDGSPATAVADLRPPIRASCRSADHPLVMQNGRAQGGGRGRLLLNGLGLGESRSLRAATRR